MNRYAVVLGDGYSFEIVKTASLYDSYPTKSAALDDVISSFECARKELAASIARAKRMRRETGA